MGKEGRIKYKPFTDYDDAIAGFTANRKQLLELAESDVSGFYARVKALKDEALHGDTIAMDTLAYLYKGDQQNLQPENYPRYIAWEFLAAARGNEFAIEKLQFLIGYVCDAIAQSPDYDTIVYKNDIDSGVAFYILGKAVCKIVVRESLKAYPIDLVALPDTREPYSQEYFIKLRQYLDASVAKTIEYLKS